MCTAPITIAEFLSAPVSNLALFPPFKPGIYAAGLQRWHGEPKLGDRILYVGTTAQGKSPELRYRVSLLVLESIGFTGVNLPAVRSKDRHWDTYHHTGGAKIWRYCTDPNFHLRKPNDPFIQRDPKYHVFIAWREERPGCCAVLDEIRLFNQLKHKPGEPQFLNDITPPHCKIHP
jgi:hypothetical protein